MLSFSLGQTDEVLELDVGVQLAALGVGRETNLLSGGLAPRGETGASWTACARSPV